MSADDFVEPDPFDLEDIVKAQDQEYEKGSEQNELVRQYLARRKQAYSAVFGADTSTADDREFVMLDLAAFCRAYTPTFHPTNQKIQDLQEGRREVFQRIFDYTRLSHDTLYLKYTDAQMKARNQ